MRTLRFTLLFVLFYVTLSYATPLAAEGNCEAGLLCSASVTTVSAATEEPSGAQCQVHGRSVDPFPPTLTDFTIEPSLLMVGVGTQTVLVSVRVLESGCMIEGGAGDLKIKSVKVKRVKRNPEKSAKTLGRLWDDGTHGDVRANDGIFTARVDIGTGTVRQVRLRITAKDLAGNEAFPPGKTEKTVTIAPPQTEDLFKEVARFPVGDGPVSLAVADLNDDGIPDLATANLCSGDITTLVGNGDGSFQMGQRISIGSGCTPFPVENPSPHGALPPDRIEGPNGVIVVDLNGDGIPDLVTANVGTNDIALLLGNGDGSFTSVQRIAVGNAPRSLTVDDLNGDSVSDLIMIITSGFRTDDVVVLLGDGAGAFHPEQRLFLQVDRGPTAVTVADLNGDGIPDLVTADLHIRSISTMLGSGDGTFQAEQRFLTDEFPFGVAVADLNDDAVPDVVTVNITGDKTLSILLGNGDGTFQPDRRFFPQDGILKHPVAVADLSGDGLLDLVLVNPFPIANGTSKDVSVVLGNGDGTFQAEQRFPVGNQPTAIVVADLNGDGLPDLVTVNVASDDVSVLLHR